MLKRLAILAVILVSCGSLELIPGQTPNTGSQASLDTTNKTDNSKCPAKPTITLIEKNCESEAFKNDRDCKAAEDKDRSILVRELPPANVSIQRNAKREAADWIAYGGDLLLVVVGFGTLIAVWKQAKRMREHADELKKLANAASSESAWVVASRVQDPYIVNQEQWHRRQDYREMKCTFSLVNAGRTPARVLAQRIELQEGDSSEAPPDRLIFESVTGIDPTTMLVPNEPIEVPARLSDNFATKASNPLPEDIGPQTAIEAGDLYLWLCGYVKYKDVLQEDVTHELRFCYLWDVVWSSRPRWIPGPAKYNSAD
jgi:hypothetical protein